MNKREKALEEAAKIFFHHWEHGGISRDNQFHQQTAYALRNALAMPIEPDRIEVEAVRVIEAARDVLEVRGKDMERSPLPAYMERPFAVLGGLIRAWDARESRIFKIEKVRSALWAALDVIPRWTETERVPNPMGLQMRCVYCKGHNGGALGTNHSENCIVGRSLRLCREALHSTEDKI